MATFKIFDDLNSPLFDVVAGTGSGLGRYLPDAGLQLRAVRPIAAALQKPLSESSTAPVALEFAVPDAVSLGDAGDLTIDARARAAVGVHHADELLFPADDLRDAISVPAGTAYVSVALAPRVRATLGGSRGPLAFGFAAGTSLSLRFFQPFDVAGNDPTLASALADTLRAAVLPADVDDLLALPIGAYVSIAGDGEVRLSGSMDLASVVNPLATPGLPIVGAARISAGASVSVGTAVRASGAFELRLTKSAPERVRLSYYKQSGSQLSIEAAASLGVSATIGESDPLKTLLAAISSDPQADLVQLVNAGLSDEQVQALQKAVAASVDRSLRVAAELQFSQVRRGEALCTFDIDLSALTPEGRDAVGAALGGDLTPIVDAAEGGGSIRAVQTGILGRRERRVAWRINLFGVLNVRGISELLQQGSLSYDAVTGTLNAADEISSKRILVRTHPLESDGEKVRKLAFESLIVTAAYQASRVSPAAVALTCSSSYFEARARTRPSDIRDDYNAIMGLGLADPEERDRRIGFEHEFGPSTFFIDCALDAAAADALFIGPQGAHSREHYERIGRDALLALIPAGDVERAHRRVAVAQDEMWRALTIAGPAAARADLERRLGAVRAAHVISDYVLIRWWADAMSDAATALVAMRQFLNGRPAASLAGDPDFARQRAKLEKELAGVVKDSKAQFGDPWGLLALDAASGRAADVQAAIVSPRLTVIYSVRMPQAERRIAAPAGLGSAPAPQDVAVREAHALKPPLTGEGRELLRRHAINLRMGAFSTDGEFQTDESDVRRLFTELLPAEIAAHKAAGGKARLLFYAHGGLIGEREGLEPVLTRLAFWRRNGVYPISFVWETGLRETITDIVRGLAPARALAERSFGEELADAILEVAARPAGKPVWSQMKRSAEVAALEGGGAAFVAQQALELWNAHHADLEIHAAGHSAGAIFQAHFLPALVAGRTAAPVPPVTVETLHLLAPACTTALFTARLKDLVGPSKPIRALTMYTMSKGLELDDRAGPYRKSLLYLVSRSFETEQAAAILGLEESVRQDVGLIRFFGLAGNQKGADLLFSSTPPTAAPRDRTHATTHGGFDDDVATMSSLMRRVLDVPDATPIVDFFQEQIERAAPASGSDAAAPSASSAAALPTSAT